MKESITKIGRVLLYTSLSLNITMLLIFIGYQLSLLSISNASLLIIISVPVDLVLLPLFLILGIIFWVTKASSKDWNLLLFNIVIIFFYIYGLMLGQAMGTYG